METRWEKAKKKIAVIGGAIAIAGTLLVGHSIYNVIQASSFRKLSLDTQEILIKAEKQGMSREDVETQARLIVSINDMMKNIDKHMESIEMILSNPSFGGTFQGFNYRNYVEHVNSLEDNFGWMAEKTKQLNKKLFSELKKNVESGIKEKENRLEILKKKAIMKLSAN